MKGKGKGHKMSSTVRNGRGGGTTGNVSVKATAPGTNRPPAGKHRLSTAGRRR